MEAQKKGSLWDFFYRILFRFTFSAKDNTSIPNLVQIVTTSRSYRNKVKPLHVSARQTAALEPKEDITDRETPEENEIVKETRECMMDAAISGLLNKVGIDEKSAYNLHRSYAVHQ